jgi:MoxR-like ATPase
MSARAQSVRHIEVHEPDIERAFANLVLDKKTLAQIGTAVNSGSSIFLYGSTGAGKTTIAETLPQVFAQDRVWIPFAVEVDGQIIVVYDPLVHRSVPEEESPRGDAR